MKHIMDLSRESFIKYFEEIGEKSFKASQAIEWLYDKKSYDPMDWSNFKNDTREKLVSSFNHFMIKIKKKEEDNLTKKYLFELEDNNHIEAVLMEHDYGLSVCISSQVGCNMGCSFCESGRLKKVRNLETHEMVEQILLIENDINKRISSVVIMGIGEPLDNYDNVLEFIKIINDDKGLAIGARHITLSTCGLVPKIKLLQELPLQINLAISLHASNNELRSKLMPINKAYSLDEVISAIDKYIEHTNRRVTIEYVMLNDVNDNEVNAKELINLLKGKNVYVNLIPYNETSHIIYKKSPRDKILKFYDILKKGGINVTIRKEFGSKISAACGQLRSKEVK